MSPSSVVGSLTAGVSARIAEASFLPASLLRYPGALWQAVGTLGTWKLGDVDHNIHKFNPSQLKHVVGGFLLEKNLKVMSKTLYIYYSYALGICNNTKQEGGQKKMPWIIIDREKISDLCRRHHIQRLALFGSVLREDFRPESDVDVLVEFEDGHIPGLAFFSMERELSEILNHKVDLNTPQFLSPYFRDQVLAEAEAQYVAA